MEKNEITIEMIRSMDPARKELIDRASKMTKDELDLLIEIIKLIMDRPDREQIALNWIGPVKDLPSALAQI